MKILYYHRFLKSTEANALPGHFFNGVLGLDQFGIKVSYIENSYLGNRILLALKVAFEIIFHSESFDLIYGSTPYGLELLILLRSIGLFRKPIVIWQHRAVKSSQNEFINKLLKLYYNGLDKMIMFTNKHIEETLATKLTTSDKLIQMQWGPDTEYFDGIINGNKKETSNNFCSTGRENRDFPTLIKAFSSAPKSTLKIYTTKVHGAMNNEKLLMGYADRHENVMVKIVENKNTNKFLANEVYKSICAVVSCNEHNYTVGLTSLLEAMALKTALITSDNPYFPFDVEKEGFGIKVPYGDAEAWRSAIQYITDHPDKALEMGLKARKFIDEKCNLNLLTYNVANCLYAVTKLEMITPQPIKAVS